MKYFIVQHDVYNVCLASLTDLPEYAESVVEKKLMRGFDQKSPSRLGALVSDISSHFHSLDMRTWLTSRLVVFLGLKHGTFRSR